MALVREENSFNHILRVMNTNLNGKENIEVALTAIRGVGRRFANVVLKIADIDTTIRAGEISNEQMDRIVEIMQNPEQFKIPAWMLNRQKDYDTGVNMHNLAGSIDSTLRNDIERMRKVRCNRGLRHSWGCKVRGQKTKSTGRFGRTVGVATKKK
ncbi:Ribosomal protein S13 [Carpediemonas membranifera]|uniref:Ribosomal protein S13 n=1 Tax=Carpediemonas membranifera TaxID=201153 RepID=A0A8J6E930_9EUKA|nr:Ribosomal protein S13 [Carpediemonas membranifera]|eukprot:KAG9392740.1 Ribosomal protein S13 [Carpediemonas membranifera]